MSPQKNRVFNSVKEAWNGVLSGSVVLTKTRKSRPARRSSCSIIDTKPSSLCLNSSSTRAAAVAASADQEDVDDYTPAECTVFVRLSNDEDEQTQKEVDISSLSNKDLDRLKVTDPFLYNSIPSIRKRNGFNVDAGRSSTRRSSLPAKMLANAEMNNQQNQQMEVEDRPVRRGSIVRKNRLSTEAHPTLVCEALLHELQALDNTADDDDNDSIGGSIGGSLFDEDDLDLLG